MNKRIRQESGLTLVELLAVIMLLSLVFLLITPIIIKAMDNYENIKADTVLRDEADLILASIYRTLYTTKETDIRELKFKNKIKDDVFSDSYLLLKNDTKIGFIDGKFLLYDQVVKASDKNIKIVTAIDDEQDYSKLEKIEEGVYRITLVLKNERKNMVRIFENDIVTIKDKKNMEGSK